MTAATFLDLGTFSVGSTERLRLSIDKNGIDWGGIDSVTLTFEKPDRATQFSRSAVVEDNTTGVWYYDLTTSDLDTIGYWTLSVRVVDGAVDVEYPYEISFYVGDEP